LIASGLKNSQAAKATGTADYDDTHNHDGPSPSPGAWALRLHERANYGTCPDSIRYAFAVTTDAVTTTVPMTMLTTKTMPIVIAIPFRNV